MKAKLFLLMLLFSAILTFSQDKSEKIIALTKPKVDERMKLTGIKEINSIYIRVFKLDGQMELWIESKGQWILYKNFPICVVPGYLGRKLIQNDAQIPEGVYQIVSFNPNSEYHLSLKLNYPNKADFYFSDSTKPGNEIFIHGGCVSVGCVAITDRGVEEVWTISKMVKNKPINVHIFSIRFDSPKNESILQTFAYTKEDIDFQKQMKEIYSYFQRYRKVPEVNIDKKGNYVIDY